MRFNTLEINRVSHGGEILRKIRCLAGHVTVFRAHAERDLETLADAVLGVGATDQFTVLLDSSQFHPEQHTFIGFRHEATLPTSLRLKDFLLKAGIGESALDKTLLDFGLGGMKERLCSELSAVQLRIARIIAATFDVNRILLLHDPFADMPKHVYEGLGKLIADYAWETKSIVVVTALGTRPDAWVENEIITRVQLERPRNPTIGLSAADPALQALRASLKDEGREAAAATGNAPKSTALTNPGSGEGILTGGTARRKPYRRRLSTGRFQPGKIIQTPLHGVIAVGSLIALMVLAIILKDLFADSSPTLQAEREGPTPESIAKASVTPPAQVVAALPQDITSPEVPVTTQVAQPVTVAALEDYPAEIRDSVRRVFDDPEGVMKLQVASTKIAAPIPARTATSPNNSRSPAPYVPTRPSEPVNIESNSIHTWSNEEMEARREEVRRRFLEAIQRASHDDEPDDE